VVRVELEREFATNSSSFLQVNLFGFLFTSHITFHMRKMCLLGLFYVVLTRLPSLILSQYSLPNSEYNALYDLYTSTNGKNWDWQRPFSQQTGYPWSFESPEENPCSSTNPWQGVTCTSTCGTKPCNIIKLDLSNHNLNGRLPASIQYLIKLKSLYLNQNQLTGTIPASIDVIIYSIAYLYI
jgi:hypothetical protein